MFIRTLECVFRETTPLS